MENIGKLKEHRAEIDASIQSHDGARQAYERLAKMARAVDAGQDIESLKTGVVMKWLIYLHDVHPGCGGVTNGEPCFETFKG